MSSYIERLFSSGEIPIKYKYIDQSRLHDWEAYYKQLNTEYRQCEDEGLEVAPLKPVFDSISAMSDSSEKQFYADRLYEETRRLPLRKGFPYHEPDSLEDILSASHSSNVVSFKPDVSCLRRKIAGAWYGRIAGCLLGKTVEVICDGIDEDRLCFVGRTEYQTPEVDTKVFFTADFTVEQGEIYKVYITDVGFDLTGVAVKEDDEV